MSNFYPYNPNLGQVMQSEVSGEEIDRGFIAHFQVSAANAVAPSVAGVHAAVTDNGAEQTISTGFTNPAVPRNISATTDGTAADIKAVQVVVHGTNELDEVISETLPVFTENTKTTVVGAKAFKTVTSVVIPVHDGTGATTSIGWGDKYGVPFKRAHIPCIASYLNNVLEGTPATMTASATAIESNTIDLNSASNGNIIDAYLVV